MSLQGISDKAEDVVQRAMPLRAEFEAALLLCPRGSESWQALYAMKLRMAGLMLACQELQVLAGAARMTHALPAVTGTALPVLPEGAQRTLTADELEARANHPHHHGSRYPDHRCAAANDATLFEDTAA